MSQVSGVALRLASRFGENFFDFVVHREAANVSLREDYFAINHDIELTALARFYLNLLIEAGVE
jgi:hypothetical protein